MRITRLSTSLMVVASVMLGAIEAVDAQDSAAIYPSRPVEFVVPFPAGGTADVLARLIGQAVSENWGQVVVVQNKAGATGALGSEFVARAPADGYMLLMPTGSTHTVLPAFRNDLPYDSDKSFVPVALLATVPNMLVVNPRQISATNTAELIAFLKKNPGKVNFASSGIGGSPHFAGELFKLMSGTNMTHVPYRGSAPALNDLIAGNVQVTIDNLSTVWPQVQQGNLRALGVASPKRTPLAPDVPTIAETLPGYEAVSWNGLMVPANTPPTVVEKISKAFLAAIQRPDIAKRMTEMGLTPTPLGAAEFGKFVKEDRARWERVAREMNLTAAANK